jgi:hypothetical protein
MRSSNPRPAAKRSRLRCSHKITTSVRTYLCRVFAFSWRANGDTLIEMQTRQWKARAQAKQKWLERTLAQPIQSADYAAWRTAWIKRALNTVKRGQLRSPKVEAFAPL